jgi:hypothetical protein
MQKFYSLLSPSRFEGQPTFLNLDEPYPHEIFSRSDLGQRPRQVRRSGTEVPGRSYMRDREDCELSGKAGNCCDRAEPNRRGTPRIGAILPLADHKDGYY